MLYILYYSGQTSLVAQVYVCSTIPVATPALAHHSNYCGHPALRKPAKLFKFVPDEFVALMPTAGLRHSVATKTGFQPLSGRVA